MRTLIFFSGLCLLSVISTNGQTTLDKIDNGLYKAGRVNDAGTKLKGLFKKKSEKEKVAAPSVQQAPAEQTTSLSGSKMTILTVTGIDYAKLKSLNENIKACTGVQTTDMKYGNPSTIRITHTGTTEDLMKLIGETSKDIFTDKNIEEFEEGKVTVKI